MNSAEAKREASIGGHLTAAREASSLPERIRLQLNSEALANLIGGAPNFLDVVARAQTFAKSRATVLITGETGTGKEMVARAIHYLSDRADFPFVPINCGALTDSLLEDELFGHSRGAFTDAHVGRAGLIEAAEGGTLFIDEVDSLSAKGQVTLLRVLQDYRYRPIGSNVERDANVRVIAASNGDLENTVKEHLFRADLYYRLAVFRLRLPALRERPEDIVPLALHFIKKHSKSEDIPKLSSEACHALLRRDWPGNVRELENAIIRGCQFCQAGCISLADLDLNYSSPLPANTTASERTAVDIGTEPPETIADSFCSQKRQLIASFEKQYLARLMREHRGNVTHAARAARKDRREFGKLLKKYSLVPKTFQAMRL